MVQKVLYKYSSGAALIMLTMLIAILLFLFMVPTEVQEEYLGPSLKYNNSFLEASPGEVPVDRVSTDTRYVRFSTMNIDNTLQDEPEILSNQFTISSGTYSTTHNTVSFNINDLEDILDAKVQFTVMGREGSGNLKILLNGQVIYLASPALGEQVSVVLPTHLIQNGQNYIKITASSPGLKIWNSNGKMTFLMWLSCLTFLNILKM